VLETINWDDVAEFRPSVLPEGDEDLSLSKEIGTAHEYLFTEQDRKPAWKIVVISHNIQASSQEARVDILFVSHHAIADGTSCAAFHKTLIKFLHEATVQPNLHASWPYEVPAELPTIPFIEQVCPFAVRPEYIPTDKGITSRLDPWTGAPPTLDGFASVVKPITIPPSNVSMILTYCRGLKITLTGLLHSLIVMYLAKAIPDAHGFRAGTPYSMRRFSGASDNEILNHISQINTDWDENIVSSARSAAEGSKEEQDVILKITTQYQAEITEELSRMHERGAGAINKVSKIKDIDQYCEDVVKGSRTDTYEISNIGVVSLPEQPMERNEVELQKLTFTQSPMVAGSAIGCSVISIKSKPLVVSLHWQKDIVGDDFMHQMGGYIEQRLLHLGETRYKQ
jgi:hypothetical protein